jgi:hypothetical protein
MADPNKYKSVSVNMKAYNAIAYLKDKLRMLV